MIAQGRSAHYSTLNGFSYTLFVSLALCGLSLSPSVDDYIALVCLASTKQRQCSFKNLKPFNALTIFATTRWNAFFATTVLLLAHFYEMKRNIRANTYRIKALAKCL